LPEISADTRRLFAARAVRLFAYGLLSVVLALHLRAIGLSAWWIGTLLTLTLLGDIGLSLLFTTRADTWGRRRVLMAGAALLVFAAAVFLRTDSLALLLFAATVGVVSPSGQEVGPFLAVEHAALASTVGPRERTRLFSWYNLTGAAATACGALAGGWLASALQGAGWGEAASYRAHFAVYGAAGLVLLALFARLTPAIEVEPAAGAPMWRRRGLVPGLHGSRGVVLRLSGLFALDAFGGAFIVQSLLALWLHLRFGADPAAIGTIFFFANLLAAVSALAAGWLARRFGLVNTMVWTHLPSNLLLLLVPLMPTLGTAVGVLLLRFSISQMDVPTRQSYTVAVVAPDERSAAAGVTGVARSIGAAVPPLFAAALFGQEALRSLPFFLAGGCKIVYDLALYAGFRGLRPPEEHP
jgi:MFS family permease